MNAAGASTSGLWPQVEDLVSPDLPPDVAVARLVALARSLLIENRELRDALELTRSRTQPDLLDSLRPSRRDGGMEAA